MSWAELVRLYRLGDEAPRWNLRPRLDIRPTDDIVIVRRRADGGREAALARWWLVPAWAKALSAEYPMFNARAESLAERKSFADAFQRRRCLIPASGFYEWKAEGAKRKTRYYIAAGSGAPLAFAGLWERNERLGIESCAIVVTRPNALMATIHSRMPAILAPADWDAWLAEPRQDLLRPAPEGDLVAYPVPSDIADDDDPGRLARPA